MQYAFCYEGIYLGNDFSSFKCLDNNWITFYWIDITELNNINIVPNSVIKLITSDNKGITHFIERI